MALNPVATPAGNHPGTPRLSSALTQSEPSFKRPPKGHGLGAAAVADLQALSDDHINAAIQESFGDAFGKQYDAVRRRAITHLPFHPESDLSPGEPIHDHSCIAHPR